MTMVHSTNKDDSDLDVSLATLFKLTKTPRQKKKQTDLEKYSEDEIDEQIEKLSSLLNCMSNWEIRGMLVNILKENKADLLKDRLVGKEEQGTASTESSSSGADEDLDAPTPAEFETSQGDKADGDIPQSIIVASSGHSANADRRRQLRRSLSGENLVSKPDRRQGLQRTNSGKVERRSSSRGRNRPAGRPRSLSADRKLAGCIDTTRSRDAAGSRTCAILAKRREQDKLKHSSTNGSQGESEDLNQTQKLGHRRHSRSSSTENLEGLTSSSYHAGARRHQPRTSRNSGRHSASSHGTALDILASPIRSSRSPARSSPRNHKAASPTFLQFQPGRDAERVPTSSRGLVAVDAIVDELRASSHMPIEIAVDAKGDAAAAVPQGRDKMLKKQLSFFRRRGSKNLEQLNDDGPGGDANGDEMDLESDEESFG